MLDYTWNWLSIQTKEGHLTTTQYVEYVDAAPINNVLRSPRMNCNVESSPIALKKSFADGSLHQLPAAQTRRRKRQRHPE